MTARQILFHKMYSVGANLLNQKGLYSLTDFSSLFVCAISTCRCAARLCKRLAEQKQVGQERPHVYRGIEIVDQLGADRVLPQHQGDCRL